MHSDAEVIAAVVGSTVALILALCGLGAWLWRISRNWTGLRRDVRELDKDLREHIAASDTAHQSIRDMIRDNRRDFGRRMDRMGRQLDRLRPQRSG